MEFIDFKRAVYKQFDALANNADRLYLTNVNKDELWDCYINSYPLPRRHAEITDITVNDVIFADRNAKRQKILDLMAKKQDAELESKSYEELAKELEALS